MTNERAINVIKDIKNYYNDKSEYYEDGYIGFDKEDNEAIDLAIKALEQRWIPVSERLPEVDGRYLTTVKGYNCNKIRSFTNNLYVIDKYEFSGRKAGWYFYDSEYGYIEETDVIAWMPLPEPYKEDAE